MRGDPPGRREDEEGDERAVLAAKRQRAYTRMYQVGAHYVVDNIAEIMPCLDDIEARLRRGEAP